MKHHVHPETYVESDSFDVRRYQLHTRQYQCDLTHCTFSIHFPEYQTRYVELAKQLKQEIKQHERDENHRCAICHESISMREIESGQVAEMFDPQDDDVTQSDVVHAECGISRGWEVS